MPSPTTPQESVDHVAEARRLVYGFAHSPWPSPPRSLMRSARSARSLVAFNEAADYLRRFTLDQQQEGSGDA